MTRAARNKGSIAGEPDPDAACRNDDGAIYCNAISPGWWEPPIDNPAIPVADDVAIAAVGGCELDRYVIKVNGDADGSGDTRPYSVTTLLYPTCPGATGATAIPGTVHVQDIATPGADGDVIVIPTPGATLQVPAGTSVRGVTNLYLSIRFSRLNCSIAVGAPATLGFSADSLDFPGFACKANLGGFLPDNQFESYGKHASFYLELYATGDCADPFSDPGTEAFPNYKSSNHAGLSYTPGGQTYFADDISLEVPQCFMTAMEVAVKGNGVTSIDLRVGLNDVDPVNGGVIPFDSNFFVIGGTTVKIAHRDFDPPILLTQPNLWVGFQTTGASTGPIIVDKEADLGQNEDAIWVHDGTRWIVRDLGENDSRYAATDVTIFCQDSPPQGACCDMVLTNNTFCVGGDNNGLPCDGTEECPGGTCIGDSVCRDDIPAMNCATGHLPALWSRNNPCAGVCVGGDRGVCDGGLADGDPCREDDDCPGGGICGLPCTRQLDCPGFRCVGGSDAGDPCETDNDCTNGSCNRAACDGPFIRSCGLAACCTVNDECFDMIEKECYEVPPIEDPRQRMYQLGKFCGLSGQRCPRGACLGREGDCQEVHAGKGCDDPFCCTDVCNDDSFCCIVTWDQTCVDLAAELCPEPPNNNECSGEGNLGAQLLPVPSYTRAEVANASTSFDDPGFCCHSEDPGAAGLGSVWYKFYGPAPPTTQEQFTSVNIDTCPTNTLNGKDSLLQAFTTADADVGVCNDGTPCSIMDQDCADQSLCVSDLTDESACRTLIPIACSDDVGENQGCTRPQNARICLQNVVPGWPYYIMLAAKDAENLDAYYIDLSQDCDAEPPIPNDACVDGEEVNRDGPYPIDLPFDLSGGEDYSPATYDCLMEHVLLPNMQNDIWYDWEAPCSAEVDIYTCDVSNPDPNPPNTTMLVYEGCECPVSDPRVVAANDFCGFGCLTSSCVSFDAVEGQCYKVRLGGHLGGTPAGDLTFDINCPDCPNGPVTFSSPVSGTVDARQPHPPDNASARQGIDTLVVEGPPGAGMNRCWSLCETASVPFPNDIADVVENGDGTFTVLLDRPMTANAVTTISYIGMNGVETRGVFHAHPANSDGNAFANGADLATIIDALGGTPGPYGLYSTDINHSGNTTAADMLRAIDLLNGGDEFLEWRDSPRPACGACCP
jgi:hypothetical protein